MLALLLLILCLPSLVFAQGTDELPHAGGGRDADHRYGAPAAWMSPCKAVRSTVDPVPTGAATESTLSTLNGKFPTAFAFAGQYRRADGHGHAWPAVRLG